MKLTEWYRPDQKPVRVGWYERLMYKSRFMDYWNGEEFLYGKRGWACILQELPWRGIAK